MKEFKIETEKEAAQENRIIEIEHEINKLGEKKNHEKSKKGRSKKQELIDKLNTEKKQINLKREALLKEYKKSEYSPKKEESIPEEKTENVVRENISNKKENWFKTKFASIPKLFSTKEKINSLPEEVSTSETKELLESNEIETENQKVTEEENTEGTKENSVKLKPGDKVEFSDENFDTIKKVEEFEYIKPEETEEENKNETREVVIEPVVKNKSKNKINYMAPTGSIPVLFTDEQPTTPEIKESTKVEEKNNDWLDEYVKEPIKEEVLGQNTAEVAEEIEEVKDLIMPSNERLFGSISTKAQETVSKLYIGINKISPIARFISRVGIGYNQKLMDFQEGRSLDLKDDVDGLNIEINLSKDSNEKIRIIMEDLKQKGNSEYLSLASEIKNNEININKMSAKRDTLQSKMEAINNSLKLFTNKRDQIASKMVEHYNEKLTPIEENLAKNENLRERLDLFVLGKEAKHEAMMIECQDFKNTIEDYIKAHEGSKISEDKIRNSTFVKNLEKKIANNLIQIEKQKKEIEVAQKNINEKIAKIDKKANVYRDRKDEFIRIKDIRPIIAESEKRENLIENNTIETTSSNPRTNPTENTSQENYGGGKPKFEISPSLYNQMPSVSSLIKEYNEYVKRNGLDSRLVIDNSNKLLKYTDLKENDKITLKSFKTIMKSYYKIEKVPENLYSSLLDNNN